MADQQDGPYQPYTSPDYQQYNGPQDPWQTGSNQNQWNAGYSQDYSNYAAGQPYQQPGPGQTYGYQQQSVMQYPMNETDRTLRLIAFIFNIISLISVCWAIIPLAWMIPMCVISWGIYKGTKANTTAFGVCTLIFVSLIGGILLLCSTKDR